MKISSIGIGFLSAALLCGRASAVETDYAAGTQAMALQQAAGTARAMGMGSAVVAVPQGAASLLWNPASLSRMSCKEISLHDDQGLGSLTQEILIYGQPLGEVKEDGKGGSWGGIAASLDYVNYGSFNGTDALGNTTGNYGAEDYSGNLGWGKELLPHLSGGVAVKVDHSDLAGQGYDAFAADIGLLYAVLPSLDFGVTYSNLNLTKGYGSNQITSGWRLGTAWTVYKHWILAAAGELENNTDGMNRMQFGTEYLIGNVDKKTNVLALRAGYQANYPNPELSGLTGLTFGVGYEINRSWTFDYAMVPTGSLGISHRLSLTFKFDCPKRPQHLLAAAAPMSAAAPIPAAAPIVIKSILLGDSHFDFDKSTLRPEGMQVLRENVQVLKDNPDTMVRVAGYTSMMGTAEYNQKLSERRAASVENFLVTEGNIAPGRITTVGYGATHPATYEATPGEANTDAAKSNMRVLFEVTVK